MNYLSTVFDVSGNIGRQKIKYIRLTEINRYFISKFNVYINGNKWSGNSFGMGDTDICDVCDKYTSESSIFSDDCDD